MQNGHSGVVVADYTRGPWAMTDSPRGIVDTLAVIGQRTFTCHKPGLRGSMFHGELLGSSHAVTKNGYTAKAVFHPAEMCEISSIQQREQPVKKEKGPALVGLQQYISCATAYRHKFR